MSFDSDEDGVETFDLTVRNTQAVWDVLNGLTISHVVGEESSEEMTIEFDTAESHDAAVDIFRDTLGSSAFPEGKWPEMKVE